MYNLKEPNLVKLWKPPIEAGKVENHGVFAAQDQSFSDLAENAACGKLCGECAYLAVYYGGKPRRTGFYRFIPQGSRVFLQEMRLSSFGFRS